MAEKPSIIIKSGMENDWQEFVDHSIDTPGGQEREYALVVLGQASAALAVLGAGGSPEKVISRIDPQVTLIQAKELAQTIVRFSPRGEEFRVFWNEWHERDHPSMIYDPSRVTVGDQTLILIAPFDSKLPITRSPGFENIVKAARELAAAR